MKITRENLLLAIESFGIVTAIAFVFSALVNGLVFWLAWGINYFLVASPADVVMSGFLVVGLFAVLVSLITALIVVLFLFWRISRNIIERGAKSKRILPEIVGAFADMFRHAVAMAVLASIISATTTVVNAYRSTREVSELQAAAIRVMNDQISTQLRTEDWKAAERDAKAKHDARVRLEKSGAIVEKVLAEQENAQKKQFSYPTGLQVSGESTVPSECKYARILWIGSASAVVGCKNGVRVFHKLDPIISEAVR